LGKLYFCKGNNYEKYEMNTLLHTALKISKR